ncbi:MAG: response regulator [Candidatus Omnitrophota bacterium]|jgi:pilus assembly protein CpaE|nr:MAG: response regulator [Candidatus Omnitrophota bacterium]
MDASTTQHSPKGFHTHQAVVIDRNHNDLVICNKALAATERIEVAGETTSFALAASLVDRHKPDFVFIAIGETPDSESGLIEKIRKNAPMTKIIAVSEEEDTDLILRCFRAGADEFLIKPLQAEELIQVFERLRQRRPVPTPTTKAKGKVIAFWGTRGGCGTTTLACNTAHMLQQSHPTIVVDFHFTQGDLAIHFDLQPNLSLFDLVDNTNELDETMIDSIKMTHASGLDLLLQPFDRQPAPLSNQEIVKIIQLLQAHYTYVVLDIGHDDFLASLLLPHTNRYCMIVAQDLSSVFLSTRKLQFMQDAGCNPKQIVLVVNEYARGNAVSLSRISKALRRSDFMTIRKDDKKVLSALNQGIPLADVSRRGKACKDIKRLVDLLQKPDPDAEVEDENCVAEMELDKTALVRV